MNKKRKNSRQFNKKFKKRFFTVKSAIIIGLTIVIILFLGVGRIHQRRQADRYQETINELTSEVKEIKEKNKALEEEKDNVDSDEFKERVAREKLGMVDKDEYSVKESEGQEESSEDTTALEESDE